MTATPPASRTGSTGQDAATAAAEDGALTDPVQDTDPVQGTDPVQDAVDALHGLLPDLLHDWALVAEYDGDYALHRCRHCSTELVR